MLISVRKKKNIGNFTIHVYCYIYLLDIDNCTPNPCKHGSGCTDLVNGYICSCSAGYTGQICDVGKNIEYISQLMNCGSRAYDFVLGLTAINITCNY